MPFSILNQTQIISISVNLVIFILAIIFSLLILKLIKFKNKNYKILFLFYTIFWIPLMLLRNYTGPMHSAIGSDASLLFLPMAAYGFVGIFARVFYDYFAFVFRSRKTVIYTVLVIEIITFIPIIISPSLATNIIQSIGVGLGASCIGMYQLFFNEQYGKSKFFLTVSILSIPPILADFISSPIQSLVVSFDSSLDGATDPNIMKYLWVIGLIFIVIAFIIGFFVNEDKKLLYCDNNAKEVISGKKDWIIFASVLIVGTLLSFIKFANSGSIAQLQLNMYGDKNGIDTKPFQGYLSLIFSFSQLIAGLLTGLVLIKKFNKVNTFIFGCFLWILYHIMSTFITNPYAYMAIHSLNGFSYGIVYNLVLGSILKKCFNTNKITPMGTYQSILSAGIMASTWFTSWLKADYFLGSKDIKEFEHINLIVNIVIICCIIIMLFIFIFSEKYERKVNFKELFMINKKGEI